MTDNSDYWERLGHIDQLIINGEARIGRLMILIAVMGDRGLPTTQVELMIDLFREILLHSNENRRNMMNRHRKAGP